MTTLDTAVRQALADHGQSAPKEARAQIVRAVGEHLAEVLLAQKARQDEYLSIDTPGSYAVRVTKAEGLRQAADLVLSLTQERDEEEER